MLPQARSAGIQHRTGELQTEREGFEPSIEREPDTRLAGECLQPLGHLSGTMGDCMRRFVAGILVTLLLLAFAAQLALPAYLADRTEHRLEEGGGQADVKLKALPALTLIAKEGDSLEVEAENLEFDLEEETGDPFDDLDGFDRVDLDITDSEAGPLEIERFELTREEPDGEYQLTVRGSTTPSALAEDIGSEAGERWAASWASWAPRRCRARTAWTSHSSSRPPSRATAGSPR